MIRIILRGNTEPMSNFTESLVTLWLPSWRALCFLTYNKRLNFSTKHLLLGHSKASRGVGGGDSWHNLQAIIFHIFSVLVKLNVTVRMGNNTIGIQSYLHKFEAIHKEQEGKAFSLTSARLTTRPADGVSWHMVKIHGKSRCQLFEI